MLENGAWLSILLFTNTADYVMIYLLAHNIGDHKFENKFKHYTMLLLFGVITGMLMYIFGDRACFRILAVVFSVLIIKLGTKRKPFDIFLVSVTTFLIIFIVQSIIIGFLILWGVNDETLFWVTQLLAFMMIAILCWKWSLYGLFLLVKQKIALTLSVISLFASTYALVIFFRFNIYHAFDRMLLLGALIIITLASFFSIFMIAQARIDEASAKCHDLVNKFAGLCLVIADHDVPAEVKAVSRELQKYVTGRGEVEPLTDDHEANLIKMLEGKCIESGKVNELNLDINYHEHHATVGLGDLTYMLGTLFDNALDHGLNGPIFVYLNVGENIFELKVKNSCKEIPDKKIPKLFKKGFSTKEEVGHGQGLYELKRAVGLYNDQRFKAKITVESYYDMLYECDYLEIKIDISN